MTRNISRVAKKVEIFNTFYDLTSDTFMDLPGNTFRSKYEHYNERMKI